MLRAPDKRLESPGCRHVTDKHETTVIEIYKPLEACSRLSHRNCLIMLSMPKIYLLISCLPFLQKKLSSVHQLITDNLSNIYSVTSVKRTTADMSIDSFQLLLTASDYRRLSVVDSWQIFNEIQLLRYDY